MSPKKSVDNNPQKADAVVIVKEKISDEERLERLLLFDRLILAERTPERMAEVAPPDRKRRAAQLIIGVDEVGRGCLAGPVVACAVILPTVLKETELFQDLVKLNDSKLVPPEVREKLAERLRGICQFAVAEASVEEIDEINILQASLLAMKRAARRLKYEQEAVILIDGNKTIPSIKNMEQVFVIDGDTKSASIAAASIIAKVHRDAFMRKLAKKFPEYKWESNKGYKSPAHYAALNEHGMTIWHRKSFNCGVNMPEQLQIEMEMD
jgi:ribonuclease HII